MEQILTVVLVLWAQRSNESDATKNVLYVTVNIPDSKNVKVDLTATHLKIESDSEDSKQHYKLDLEFYKEIVPEESHYHANGINITFVLRKKELQAEYWPRITKVKAKYHYIKTDFDKWVDEDEQDGQEEESSDLPPNPYMGGDAGAGGMPGMADMASMFGGAGGAGGADGMNPDFMQQLLKMNGGKLPDLDELTKGLPKDEGFSSNAKEGDFSSSDDDNDQAEQETTETKA